MEDQESPQVRRTLNAMDNVIAEHVARNIRKYFEEKSNDLAFLIDPDMQQKVVDILGETVCENPAGDIDHFYGLIRALPALLSKETKFFNTCGVMSFCPKVMKKAMMAWVLSKVADHAPYLFQLTIHDPTGEYTEHDAETVNEICRFTKLKCLKLVDFHIDSKVLVHRVCKELEMLRFIDAKNVRINCFVRTTTDTFKKSVIMNDRLMYEIKQSY